MEALAYYGRLLALPAISTEFETLLAQGQEALEVTITSAFPLDNDEIQILESKLKARYAGKSIRVETAVDRSLIGGFEIRSSDTVIDATVRGRLSKNCRIPDRLSKENVKGKFHGSIESF